MTAERMPVKARIDGGDELILVNQLLTLVGSVFAPESRNVE